MQNKVLLIIFIVVVMQLIYFVIKSTKDRLRGGDPYLKGKEYIRGFIVVILLALLIFFMLI